MVMNSIQNNSWVVLLGILIVAFSRVVPHPPNVTPLLGMSVLAGMRCGRFFAICLTVLCLFISDVLLAFFGHSTLLGSWTFFTYTGFLMVTIGASCFKSRDKKCGLTSMIILTLFFSVGFWVWTNWGSWYVGAIGYPKNMTGLMDCYIAALPFLENALIGDLCWMMVIWGVLRFYEISFQRG